MHLQGKMPRLDFHPYHQRIPKEEKLKRVVKNHLNGKNPADHVIALTDLYTGTSPHLSIAINKCPELKAFINTILKLCIVEEMQ